jgi:hypothetical protein
MPERARNQAPPGEQPDVSAINRSGKRGRRWIIGGCLLLILAGGVAIGLGSYLAGVTLSVETDPHRWRVIWTQEVGAVLEDDDGQDRYHHSGKAWVVGPIRLDVPTKK